MVRLKGTPVHGEAGALALGFDVRFPTGNEQDFLGLGAYALRPFLAASFSHGRASSHVNFAYVWNGKSVLAGDPATGTKEDMPDQLHVRGRGSTSAPPSASRWPSTSSAPT